MKALRYTLSMLALLVASMIQAQVVEFHESYGDDYKYVNRYYMADCDSIVYVPAVDYSGYIYVEEYYFDNEEQIHVKLNATVGPDADVATVSIVGDSTLCTSVPAGTSTVVDFVLPDPTQPYSAMLQTKNRYYQYANERSCKVDGRPLMLEGHWGEWCTTAEEFAADGGVDDFPLSVSNTGTYSFYNVGSYNQPGVSVSFRQNKLLKEYYQFRFENWGARFLTASGVELVINATWDSNNNYYRLSIPEQSTGYYASNYEEYIMISDMATYSTTSWDNYPSYYNPDDGKFVLNVVYYISMGRYGWGEEYMLLEDYEAKETPDYSLNIKYSGLTTDTLATGEVVAKAMIDIQWGKDIAYAKMAVEEDGASDVLSTISARRSILKPGMQYAELPQMGKYRAYVAAYDSLEKRQSYDYVIFEFVVDTTKWTPVATGTFYYNFFSDDEDALMPEENMTMSKNDNEENTYRIDNWLDETHHFKFKWDTETNDCVVMQQKTGFTHSTYGDIYIVEGATFTATYETEEDFGKQKSYYDPTTRLFHFYPIYYVSVGYFGQYEELFQITEEGTITRHSVRAIGKPMFTPRQHQLHPMLKLGEPKPLLKKEESDTACQRTTKGGKFKLMPKD